MTVQRCAWAGSDPLMQAYHDEQWGVPVHDERMLFEMLSLEGAQAGLSWSSILQRRAAYQLLFDNFEPEVVARYDETKIAALLVDARIIRNRAKIRSVVSNAQAFLQVQADCGGFAQFLWAFVDGQPRLNCFQSMEEVPAEDSGIAGAGGGPQTPWLPLRRPDHLLRLHAVLRPGQRPRGRLFSLPLLKASVPPHQLML